MEARLPTLSRASLYWFSRHPWQLVLALIGIVAGVSVMVAVDIATDSARRAFLLSMDAVHGEATHQVVAGPRGVDESLYVDLRARQAFRNVAPVVDGYVEAGDMTLTLLGVDVFAEREFRRWTVPRAGPGGLHADDRTSGREIVAHLVTQAGTVLSSTRTAERLGIAVGDRFELLANGRMRVATLAGIVGDEATDGLDDILVADIATAQEWLGKVGWLNRIDVRIAPGDDATLQRLRAALPPGARVLDAEARTQSVREMSDAFMTNLLAMSLLALLVGSFLIYNTVSFAVLQRRALLGVLRALGVTRRETFLLIMFEALALGTVGSLLGLGGGAWLGERLLGLVSRSINDLYFVVSVTQISVAGSTLATGFAAGLGATLVAAALPALEAAASRPQLALMRSAVETRTRRAATVVAFAGIGLALLAVALLAVSGRNLPAGLAAVFMLLLGCALVVPVLVRLVASMVSPAATALGGVVARHAIGGVGASLSRTGVAVVALAVAVSATIGVSIMVDSFRSAVVTWAERSLRADLYVGVGHGSLEPTLVRDVLEVGGIARHSSSRRVWLDTPGSMIRLTVLDLPPDAYAGTRFLEGEPGEVWPAFEEDAGLLVSASYAYRHDVSAGQSVTLPTRDGPRAFPVVATFQSYDADLDSILMSRGTYDVFWDDPAIDSLGLYLEEGADPEAVARDLRRVSAGRQSLLIRSNAGLRERTMEIFNRTFVITDVLYWLAFGVAVVGILGAMLALQLERAREYAILRAVGVTRAGLGGLVVTQAGFMGLLSGLAAIPLGLAMAWVLIDVINRRAFGWEMDMAVSASTLGSAVLLATTAALLAGLYPAWRTAVQDPARAMREE